MGAVPFAAVGTVRVKPPSTAVALRDGSESVQVKSKFELKGKTYGTKTGPVTVMKAP